MPTAAERRTLVIVFTFQVDPFLATVLAERRSTAFSLARRCAVSGQGAKVTSVRKMPPKQ